MRPLVISCCPIGFGMCSSYGIPMGDPVEWEEFPNGSMLSLLKWPRCWGPYGEYFISHIDPLDVVATGFLTNWAELMKAVESCCIYMYLPSLVAQIPILRVRHLFWLNLYAFDGGILYGFIQRNCRGPAALEDLSRREPRRMAKHQNHGNEHDMNHMNHMNMFFCQKNNLWDSSFRKCLPVIPSHFVTVEVHISLLRCHWNIFVLHNLIVTDSMHLEP